MKASSRGGQAAHKNLKRISFPMLSRTLPPSMPVSSLATRAVVGPKGPVADRKHEEAAAEVKATAMARTFLQPHGSSDAAISLEEKILLKVGTTIAKVPGLESAPTVLPKIGRIGGPLFATLAFAFSGGETVMHWKELDQTERTLGVATTVVSGVAATTTIAAASGVATAAALIGPTVGAAGTLFAASAAWQAFHNPYEGAGQRGMALAAVLTQGAGALLCLTPAAPVGLGLMMVGANFSMWGSWLGKKPGVKQFFRGLGIPDGDSAHQRPCLAPKANGACRLPKQAANASKP